MLTWWATGVRALVMVELSDYAAIAEIFSAAMIVLGGIVAAFEVIEFRRRRRDEAAVELCRRFAEPELGRAVALIRRLPDGISREEIRAMDNEYEEAALIVGMTFETMGLLVHRNIASFRMIQDLTGGLLLTMWKKLEVWIEGTRQAEGSPRFGEWVQWLAERVEDREADIRPAYEVHANWNRYSS